MAPDSEPTSSPPQHANADANANGGSAIGASIGASSRAMKARRYGFRVRTAEKARQNVTAGCQAASDAWPAVRPATSTSMLKQLLQSKMLSLMMIRVPSVAYTVALQDRLEACETLLDRLHIASDHERMKLLDEHFTSATDEHGKTKMHSSAEEQVEQIPASNEDSGNDLVEVLNETSV